ncbi:DMT family transporter [Methylocystis sp. S23]
MVDVAGAPASPAPGRPIKAGRNAMTRMRADLLLLLVAFIWGTAFIAQKHANGVMGPVSFVGARFLISWIALAPLAFYERSRTNRSPLTRGIWDLRASLAFASSPAPACSKSASSRRRRRMAGS